MGALSPQPCASGAAGITCSSQRGRRQAEEKNGYQTCLSWVFSFSLLSQVHNPSCLFLLPSAEAALPYASSHSLSALLFDSFNFINNIPQYNPAGMGHWGVLPPSKLCQGDQASPSSPAMFFRGPVPWQMLALSVPC